MSDLVLPAAIDTLRSRLATSTTPVELQQFLGALQRLRFSRVELEVHIERLRAVNRESSRDEGFEANALLALDMVLGDAGDLSLDWDPPTVASIWLPHALKPEDLDAAFHVATQASDLLPPRSDVSNEDFRPRVLAFVAERLEMRAAVPDRADLFRAAKLGLTSRPAALLTIPDRLAFDALALQLAPALEQALPSSVVWPRNPTDTPALSAATATAAAWDAPYVVRTDISSFYECVHHGTLSLFLARHLDAPAAFCESVEALLDALMGASIGLPQGPPGSELLASAYLLPVDLELRDRGWQYTRYADDYYFAAESLGDARRRLEELEAYLFDLNLRLNADKTRAMSRRVFSPTQMSTSKHIERLQERAIAVGRERFLAIDDPEELEEELRDLGVDEETLFDVLYHQTLDVAELVESLRERVNPSVTTLYLSYFANLAAALREHDFPDDMAAAERDASQALFVAAAGQNALDREDLSTVAVWFPTVAPALHAFLVERGSDDAEFAHAFIAWALEGGDLTDWATAWVTAAIERVSSPPSAHLADLLRRTAEAPEIGPLAALAAIRALARHRELTESVWRDVSRRSSGPVRSELLFAALANPEFYPWVDAIAALTQGSTRS